MDIGDIQAGIIADKTAQLQVFADGQNLVSGNSIHGTVGAGIGSGLQSVDVSGILLSNCLRAVGDEFLEGGVLCHEVGLRVAFQHDAHAVFNDSQGDAFGSDLGSLLGLCGQTLFTQPVDCLFLVAIAGYQSLLAVHHADASHLAQFFYIFCGNSHVIYLP